MPARHGDKIGPRIADLVLQYTLAARRHMAPYEARVQQAATQAVIDAAGREIAVHYRPIVAKILAADNGTLDPDVRAFLEEAISGKHQFKAVGGLLTGSVAGTIGTFLSNQLAPLLYTLIRTEPNLNLDPGTLASMAAARLMGTPDAANRTAEQGISNAQFDRLLELAYTAPGAADVLDLLNRGDITEPEAALVLERAGLRPELVGPVLRSRYQLVSGADIALAQLRGNLNHDQAVQLAARSGITPQVLDLLTLNTGEPPGIMDMVSLWRRGLISKQRLTRAILQSRVRDEWVDAIELLAVQPPTQEEVLQALVQGEVSQDEARRRFEQAGGDPAWFTPAWQTRANAPSPEQAASMAHRGIIPWDGLGGNVVSFEQAFREGRWKDKYAPAFRKLATYLPPPREVTTLSREGAVTEAQAERLWEEHGLTPALAHTYWLSAHHQRTSAAHELARSEIVTLYFDQAINREQALAMLEKERWPPHDAEYILDIADLRRARSAHEAAVKKITALYVAHKIDRTEASTALHQLDIPTSQVEQILLFAELERDANLKTLTAAEILDAAEFDIVTKPEALKMLEQDGYTPLDAWIKLSIKFKGPLKEVPRP